MKISILGTGNVGTQLAKGLETAGHSIIEIYSRHLAAASNLCIKLYEAEPTTSLDFSKSKAQIFILCVSDDAIALLAKKIKLPPQGILVHTSGTVSMAALGSQGHGVFYPLQTISKSKKTNWAQVPICLESKNEEVKLVLIALGHSLSQKVYSIDYEQRKALHVAAVFACNFTNHLLKIAKDITETEGMKFEMLHSLVQETVSKAFTLSPEEGQTGPAIRKDNKTLNEHRLFLNHNDTLTQFYNLFSESIRETYQG